MKLNNALPVIIISIIFAGKSSHTLANNASSLAENKYLLAAEKPVADEPKRDRYKYVLEDKSNPVKPNTPPAKSTDNRNIVTKPTTPPAKDIVRPTQSLLFAENRGAMPWPVNNGFISAPYGQYTHPTEPKVTLENHGVNITVRPGTQVRSVFQGTVVRIEKISDSYTIILNHGEYYSVYSYVIEPNVKVGDKVKLKQQLGIAGKNDDGVNMVHFEICKVDLSNKISYENPINWINQSF